MTLDGVHGFNSRAGLRVASYRRDTMATKPLNDEQEIASDRLDELRERVDRTAQVSVHAGRHPWVRYEPPIEMYEIAEISGVGNIEVTACTKDSLINLFAENPVSIKPLTKALYSPPEPGRAHVWKAVDMRADEVIYTNPDVNEGGQDA